MKKIYKLLFTAAIVASSTTSCSDFLDQPILGKENLDTYFQTEEECLKQVTGCYQSLFSDGWWQIQAPYVGFEMSSDDLWMGNTNQSQADWYDMSHYMNSKKNGPLSNFWQYRYKGILRSNVVIERTPGAPLEESLRNRIIGEAKFTRAFHYFDLAKNFGGVPLVTGLLMPNELVGITRASLEDTYAFIEQDLKDAIASLPLKSEYSTSDLGRATKGAAMGYLAKIYLYQEKYKEAETYLDSIVASKEYELLPEFKDVWTIASNNSIESLFEIQYKYEQGYYIGNSFTIFTGSRNDSGWSWGQPTSDLENAYINAGDTERLKWTIIKHGDDVTGDPDAKNYEIKPSEHKSARIIRKYYVPKAERPEKDYNTDKIPLNYRLMRYADILLMQAEVKNALGKDAEAREALNQVRGRVNLPEVTASGDELRQAIRLERRLELAYENQRLYDIRRWTDTNGKKVICNLFGKNGSFVIYNTVTSTDPYETTNQGERSDKGINFQEDRDLVFPIPENEVTRSNGSIAQNPNF
ncbi:RagB/SusD family nutrient uptake outer membrane protein [Dysgonomonas massiliensis]|uniref:RagB/SusD family nutrient uptake outer membrane protein n=1 Tax=Dysgonomonas massiliensis TaxID=2040292 RepID=UPI000C7952F2|nr:RagB/SusD family nutrient uptake outer membrane protein [Dysgonomonas massiliensis]